MNLEQAPYICIVTCTSTRRDLFYTKIKRIGTMVRAFKIASNSDFFCRLIRLSSLEHPHCKLPLPFSGVQFVGEQSELKQGEKRTLSFRSPFFALRPKNPLFYLSVTLKCLRRASTFLPVSYLEMSTHGNIFVP